MAEQSSKELVTGNSALFGGAASQHFANAESIADEDFDEDTQLNQEELLRKINMAREQLNVIQKRAIGISSH